MEVKCHLMQTWEMFQNICCFTYAEYSYYEIINPPNQFYILVFPIRFNYLQAHFLINSAEQFQALAGSNPTMKGGRIGKILKPVKTASPHIVV